MHYCPPTLHMADDLERYQYFIECILDFIKKEKITYREVQMLSLIFSKNIESECEYNHDEFMEKEFKFNDRFYNEYKIEKKD